MSGNLPYWIPEFNLRDGIYEYLRANLPRDYNVYRGHNNELLKEPFVGVLLPSSQPRNPELTITQPINRVYAVTILMRSHAINQVDESGIVIADAEQQHKILVGTVRDLFYAHNVISLINASTQNVTIQKMQVGAFDPSIVDNSFASTQEIRIEGY